MGEAYKCDRCGNVHGGEAKASMEIEVHRTTYQTPRTYAGSVDLCNDCEESLGKWWLDGLREDDDA